MITKICNDCLRELPETMFKMHRSGKRNCVCKDCISQKMKISRVKTRDKWRHYHLKQWTTSRLLEELAYRGVVGKVYVEGNEFNLNDYNLIEHV